MGKEGRGEGEVKRGTRRGKGSRRVRGRNGRGGRKERAGRKGREIRRDSSPQTSTPNFAYVQHDLCPRQSSA